jgi:hypothetical protein
MGQLCGGVGIETPKVDMEKVGSLIETCIKEIPKDVEKNEREFAEEIKKCSGKDFMVPDSTLKLNDKSSKEDIHKAAIISACGSKIRDQIKEQVWGQIEPEVSSQIPAETPSFVKNKALDAARIPVDKAVDAAVDKVLEKLQQANDANNEEKKGGDYGGDQDEKKAMALKLPSSYEGTYTASGGASFDVTSGGNNIKWPSGTGTTVPLTTFVTSSPENAGTTNNSTIPLKRCFTFNNVGSPSKSWVIHYNDTTLTRLQFTSTNNTGWVGTWTSSRDGSFTIQEPSAGTFTLTRNSNTHSCTFIDQTNLTNVMLSHFDSSSQPCIVVLTASNGISIIKNASNGAWTTQAFDKTA